MFLVLSLLACGQESAEATHEAAPAVEKTAEAAPSEAAPSEAAAPARDDATWKYFGEPFTLASAVPAAQVFGDPAAHEGKPVRVLGELTEVCQKAGCWAVVRDDAGNAVRVTMKDHGFGIDKDTRGRACDVEGQLVKKAVDPERVEHFKSEGSAHNPEEGKTETWEIVVSSIAVARS